MKIVLLVPDLDGAGAHDVALARRWLDRSGLAGLTLFEADIGDAGRVRHGTAFPVETQTMLAHADAAFAPCSVRDEDIRKIVVPLIRPAEAGETALLAALQDWLKRGR